MTTEQITQNNKLIAEFMGLHPYPNGDVFFGLWYDTIKLERFENLLYHTSWDWLMPVVGKIKDKCEELKITLTSYLIAGLITVNIDTVYKAVVEFINWYNQQQNGA